MRRRYSLLRPRGWQCNSDSLLWGTIATQDTEKNMSVKKKSSLLGSLLLGSLWAFLGIGAATHTAHAQEAPTQLEEVVVTAQKREERLQNVPISIAVLDGKVLDGQAVGGTLEALTSVPGISANDADPRRFELKARAGCSDEEAISYVSSSRCGKTAPSQHVNPR